jgi:hypothetical protein
MAVCCSRFVCVCVRVRVCLSLIFFFVFECDIIDDIVSFVFVCLFIQLKVMSQRVGLHLL